MCDYPDPEEEFELMYGDELELLREQEEINEPPVKSRKSLDFGTPSTSKYVEKASRDSNQNVSQSMNSFEDFPTLLSQSDFSLPNGQVESTRSTKKTAEELFGDITHILPNSQSQSSQSRKRTVEDLFGDINDIVDDVMLDDQPNVKKHKDDKHEEDLALIEHILHLRKLAKEKHSLTTTKKSYSISTTERDKQNLSYRIPKYPFIGVKRPDSERVYIRFHSEEFEIEETQRIVNECNFKGVMGDSFKEVWNEARSLINTQMDWDLEIAKTQSEVSVIQDVDEAKQLWVDLYKPKKYLELLSDESTNRIMLRWMKLWDKVVFNRKPKIKPIKLDENNKKRFFQIQELKTDLDEHGRPEHKVALLCGPPGLGKTTLAHMVAKHAGYNVVEINASDDRSTEAFKTSLENATQMRSVLDQERRPNCLVFDEIDGAPQTSIDYLVKFINGSATTKSKKGKSQKQSVLKRPIICICNDVYVPALRPLRQIAFVVNFPQTSSTRLAERLMEIARREGVKTDLGAMLALSGKSNNDIRSCLSVLHFFKAQNKPVTLSDVYRASIGQKDMQKGLFSVWQDIFQIEKSKVSSSRSDNDHNQQSLKFRMAKVIQTISAFGDYEKVAQGVFENFPVLKIKDTSLEGICQSLEWFVFSDLLNKHIYALQNYALSSYLQYGFVVWHFVFATMQNQQLKYPTADYEARQKQIRQKALVSEVLRGMQPSVRAYCQRLSLVLDILPFLTRIIVPPFRPVSLHLYTKEERENMLKVVNIMIDYNLSYVQERTPDGVYAFNLEPNIEEIVTFDKSDLIRRNALSYSNKQLISREIEMEKMRRFEAPRLVENEKKKNSEAQQTSEKNQAETQLPNHLQTLKASLKAKTVKAIKSTVTKDFFGRVISKPVSSSGKIGPNLSNDIWYQYKEGYNNAVRKRIEISNLK